MSKLNCRPGDLAYMTGMVATPEANGMIVEIVRRAVNGEILREKTSTGKLRRVSSLLPSWIVRGHSVPTRTGDGVLSHVTERAVCDCHLRPIRDQPGEDETLAWAGKPAHEHQERARELLDIFEGVAA